MSKKRHWRTFVYIIRKTLRGDFVNLCSLWTVLRFFRDFNFSANQIDNLDKKIKMRANFFSRYTTHGYQSRINQQIVLPHSAKEKKLPSIGYYLQHFIAFHLAFNETS